MSFKYLSFLVALFLLAQSCTEHRHEHATSEKETAQHAIDESKYPENLLKVFGAHGGLNLWNQQQSMAFEIVKEPKNEVHIIDLKSRKDRVEGANFKMGFDGNEVWMEADSSYKGNADFYHNLMFYFYAMPFVVADDGIIYSETEPLVFDDKTYPGIKISYHDGVGVSPKDEYLVHYDPETYQMAWLGYTATYFTQQKKETFNWIRYDNWGETDGLILPNSMSWYKVEEGKLVEPRNTVSFVELKFTETPLENEVFAKPI